MIITDYRNFDLPITRAGQRYRAFVVDASASEVSVVYDLPFAMDGVAWLDTWMSGDHDHQATCPPKEDDGPVVWIGACLTQDLSAMARPVEKQAQLVQHVSAQEDFIRGIITHDLNARQRERPDLNIHKIGAHGAPAAGVAAHRLERDNAGSDLPHDVQGHDGRVGARVDKGRDWTIRCTLRWSDQADLQAGRWRRDGGVVVHRVRPPGEGCARGYQA